MTMVCHSVWMNGTLSGLTQSQRLQYARICGHTVRRKTVEVNLKL